MSGKPRTPKTRAAAGSRRAVQHRNCALEVLYSDKYSLEVKHTHALINMLVAIESRLEGLEDMLRRLIPREEEDE